MRALCYTQLLAVAVFLLITALFTEDILAPTTVVASDKLDCQIFATALPEIRKALRPRAVAAERANLVLPVNKTIAGARFGAASENVSQLPNLGACAFAEDLGIDIVDSPETYSFTLNFTRIVYMPENKSASFTFYWQAPNIQGKAYQVNLQVIDDFEWRVVSVDRAWVI